MSNNERQGLREATNLIRQQLNKENRKFFDDIRHYLFFASVLLDEISIVEQIYQIAIDISEAQAHGESAESYFGSQPKEIADEIIQNTPRTSSKTKVKLCFLTISIFWGGLFLGSFISSKETIVQPIAYLLSGLLVPVFLLTIIKLAQRSVYQKSKKSKGIMFLIFYLVFVIFTLLASLTFLGPLDYGRFVIESPHNISLLVGLIILLLGLVVSQKSSKMVKGFASTWLLTSLCVAIIQVFYHLTNISETVIAFSGCVLVCLAIVVYILVLSKIEMKK